MVPASGNLARTLNGILAKVPKKRGMMVFVAKNRSTILLLGNYRPALSVARGLSAAGYHVVVSRDDDAGAATWSRAVAEIWDTPGGDDIRRAYDALAVFLEQRPDIELVFPLMERWVRAFFDHVDLLPDDRTYVMPNQDAVEACLDKNQLLRIVSKAKLHSAKSTSATDMDTLRAAAKTVGFPAVVKPADSTIWLNNRKALILNDQTAFDQAFPSWPKQHEALIVQTFVDGPRRNLYFAAPPGEPACSPPVLLG